MLYIRSFTKLKTFYWLKSNQGCLSQLCLMISLDFENFLFIDVTLWMASTNIGPVRKFIRKIVWSGNYPTNQRQSWMVSWNFGILSMMISARQHCCHSWVFLVKHGTLRESEVLIIVLKNCNKYREYVNRKMTRKTNLFMHLLSVNTLHYYVSKTGSQEHLPYSLNQLLLIVSLILFYCFINISKFEVSL